MDDGNDSVALGHGERAAGAEVVLDVDDEEDVVRGGVHGATYQFHLHRYTELYICGGTSSISKRFALLSNVISNLLSE